MKLRLRNDDDVDVFETVTGAGRVRVPANGFADVIVPDLLEDDAPGRILGPGYLGTSESVSAFSLRDHEFRIHPKPRHVSDDYEAAVNDDLLLVDTTSSSVDITLPPARFHVEREINVKDAGGTASVNNITVTPATGDTIEGGASPIATDNANVTLRSDGESRWYIV